MSQSKNHALYRGALNPCSSLFDLTFLFIDIVSYLLGEHKIAIISEVLFCFVFVVFFFEGWDFVFFFFEIVY